MVDCGQFQSLIMLEFILSVYYTLNASKFLNNYSYSIIKKKIAMEVDPQR